LHSQCQDTAYRRYLVILLPRYVISFFSTTKTTTKLIRKVLSYIQVLEYDHVENFRYPLIWYATFSGNLEQNVKQLSILPKANTLIQNKSFGADCSIDKCFSSSPQITGYIFFQFKIMYHRSISNNYFVFGKKNLKHFSLIELTDKQWKQFLVGKNSFTHLINMQRFFAGLLTDAEMRTRINAYADKCVRG
jgi:hypothetical protein